MAEKLQIETERVDDIPLLLSQMQHMKLAELLDKHIPTHGNRKGLSLGTLTTVWLTHVLSQADHRMNQVQAWGERRLETLRGCEMTSLEPGDLADDRLADVLHALSIDKYWFAFEQELMVKSVRVYDLLAQCVRIDTTTAKSYADVTEEGLLQLGHSKDHRPDLAQMKVVLASLDPMGMPLATEVISGEHADDPLYVPIINRVRDGLQRPGLLYVGDCKMAALKTRASIQAAGDYYLCPLSALQVSPTQLRQEVDRQRETKAALLLVEREDNLGQKICIAQGYEVIKQIEIEGEEMVQTWQERHLMVQSEAFARTAEQNLRKHLQQAEDAIKVLTVRKQGKPRLKDRNEVEKAIDEILRHFQVKDFIDVQIQE